MPPDEPRPHERLAFRRTKSTGDGGHVDETWVAQESSVVVLLADEDDPSSVKAATTEAERKDEKPKPASAKPQTKILFLDGVRGLAAILVVTQHSGFMHDVNLGACAVDIFFVLSSFLLTWLFYKKSTQLFAQKASYRKWGFALVDYFSKRFFRVYPLFAVVTIVLWLLPDKAKKQYFHVAKPEDFDLFKVLTFQFDYRYHVFWTLPLEIVYYFLIPVFVLLTLRLHRFWWIPLAPMYVWVVYKGLYAFRTSHMPLRPHLPTFLSGSMAAVIFVKLEQTIKQQAFEFCVWHKCLVRALEYAVLGLLVSTCFNGLLFHWTQKDPELPTKVPKGFPYISLHVTVLIVIEMLLPSWLSSALEWSVLRFWGKISFSVYLLHSFVIYAIPVRKQAYYYDRLFSGFLLTLLLATASYYAVEHLSQLLSVRISKALAAREALVGKPIRSPGEVMESGQSQKEDEVMVVAAVAAPH